MVILCIGQTGAHDPIAISDTSALAVIRNGTTLEKGENDALTRLARHHGAPKAVFEDNGGEFPSRLKDAWAYRLRS